MNPCFYMIFQFNSYQKGILAELYVLLYYFIFERAVLLNWRFKTKVGEVDLILKSKKVIIFVEVKYRKKGDFFDVVDEFSLKRIENAASLYIKTRSKYQSCRSRIDVCYVNNRLKLRQKRNIIC